MSMSHKRIRVTPSTAKVSFIDISPSKRQRRRVCSLENAENSPKNQPAPLPPDDLVELDIDDNRDSAEETEETSRHRSYQQRQQRASEAWTEIRDLLCMAYVESSVPGIECHCILCNAPATVMCQQCSPQVFFCTECTESQHSVLNIFHRPQLWKVCTCHVTYHLSVVVKVL